MRKYLKKNDYYDEIKLWHKTKENNAVVGVVVEAKPDKLFFRKFFSDITVFFPVDGAGNVKDIISEVEKDKLEGIVGIIDADFTRITNEIIKSNKIFHTDCHDVEMMMVNSEARNNVISFYMDKDKLKAFENKKQAKLKNIILNTARPIASVRFLNFTDRLGLKFKTLNKKRQEYNFIDYHKFIDKNTLDIDKKIIQKIIENKSMKQGFLTNSTLLKEKISAIEKENYDLLEFNNGHDLINILSIALKKVISNKVISSKNLEDQFIIAYRFSDFKATELYLSLADWVKINNEFVLW